MDSLVLLVLLSAGTPTILTWIVWRRTGDPFHPLVVTAPMLVLLYTVLPLHLILDSSVYWFLTDDELIFSQFVMALGVASFCLGMFASTLHAVRWKGWNDKVRLPATADKAALVLGVISLTSFVYGLLSVGGLSEAYGRPYAGGWVDFGYLREARDFSIPAIALILLSCRPLSHWKILQIALFSSPLLLHAVLGARRGPLFFLIAVLVIGYSWRRQLRPPLIAVLLGGTLIGGLLLLIVSNRGAIYLGSEWAVKNSPLDYFEPGTGNEYIYSAATIAHFHRFDAYYWGRRYLAIVFVRPIPKELWSGNKYEIIGLGDINENVGTRADEFQWSFGWSGARGSSPGIVADMWAELSWLSVGALFGIGWTYGVAWKNSRSNPMWAFFYIVIITLSLHLVWQTLEAMLFRTLFLIVPTIALLWFFRERIAPPSAPQVVAGKGSSTPRTGT